ncbi:MAG TPA: bifunctional DNA-formamidopyrimidine glycosylase/DNA-(apurinic or apyrimidinic site) lyase [Phycisphaerae bacterium]|nr:bifunctional DNA-formamidopyrimidine glycosylase/DNA-(apurinic or apyrimidinic site) lyase [Phycisphaerae bacterium]
MPELPEAETLVQHVRPRLIGARITRIVHLRRDILRHGPRRVPRWLSGARVADVIRRGKRPIIQFEDGQGLIVLLGMTGYLGVHPASDVPRPHTHLRLALDDGTWELRFADARRFGGLSFYESWNGVVPPGLADLGIEPLDMTLHAFRRAIARDRQIKALLMDQSAIAGLGNIYCDEALHRAGIHPLAIASRIDGPRVARLCRAIRAVLRESIRHEGTTIINFAHPDGPGNFADRLRVYDRTGEPCRKCRTPIARELIAGRSTHFCPLCQAVGGV